MWKSLQSSSKFQANLPALCIVVGIVAIFTMHAPVFGGGSAVWRQSLLITAGILGVASFFVVVTSMRRPLLNVVLLGAPFVGVNMGLYSLSTASGGDPHTFAQEMATVVFAIVVGAAVGGIGRI